MKTLPATQDEMNALLTFSKLSEYISSKPQNEIAGVTCKTAACPIAQYLSELYPGYRFVVMTNAIQVDDEVTTHYYGLPEDVSYLIEGVDNWGLENEDVFRTVQDGDNLLNEVPMTFGVFAQVFREVAGALDSDGE
jgi:hypothetical protein